MFRYLSENHCIILSQSLIGFSNGFLTHLGGLLSQLPMLGYHINVAENCRKLQSDRFLTLLCIKNVSVKLHKCVINVSSDSFPTVFICECFLPMFHPTSINVSEICQKWYFLHFSDCFSNHELTVFWHIYKNWYISKAFPKTFWLLSDRLLYLTVFWLILDTYLTVFWLFYVTDSFLTDFWQIYDCFS